MIKNRDQKEKSDYPIEGFSQKGVVNKQRCIGGAFRICRVCRISTDSPGT